MVKGGRIAAIIGLGLLGACTRVVDDPLAVHSIYWGLVPMSAYEGELPEVLFSAPDTPAKQGLLYTAMVEAEVAAQYASRAEAANDPLLARSALGEVLYAIDPNEAPAWEAKSAGIVAGWAGRGYGVRRAAGDMAAQIRAAAAQSDASPALTEYGPLASGCAENTLTRADQIVALTRQVTDGAIAQDVLRQIHELANQLNQGARAAVQADDPACGLEEAERYLERVAPQTG